MKTLTKMRLLAAILAMVGLAAGCGGGGDGGGSATIATGGGTGGTGASVLSEGVMRAGSVIVNGVRFDDSSATVLIDDSIRSRTELRDGMVVKVLGTVNDDKVTGAASRIEVENEVRGTVQSVNAAGVPPSFVVLGQRVYVDEETVVANLAGSTPAARVGALVPNVSFVEVHGQRDTGGNIIASRVELFGGTALGDELRGTVTALAGSTFSLNGIAVNGAGALLTPSGAALANGQLVEVHGSFAGGVFVATRIDREDLEDAVFNPGSGGRFEVEGFVTGFSAHPGTFTVNGRSVQTTSTTRFEGGAPADLSNNVKVEVEGVLAGSAIVAEKLVFKRVRVILAGVASTINAGARTLIVLNQTVTVNDLTDIRPRSGSGLGAIPPGNRVEVRGYVSGAGTIVAERLDDNGTGGGADIVQGQVLAENESVRTLTVLGVSANLAGGAVSYQDANNAPISAVAFFAAVTPRSGTTPGTLVKLKGTFSGLTLIVDEAELEN